jgi:hypothetical protein
VNIKEQEKVRKAEELEQKILQVEEEYWKRKDEE